MQFWCQQFLFIFLRTNLILYTKTSLISYGGSNSSQGDALWGVFLLGQSPPLTYGSRRLYYHTHTHIHLMALFPGLPGSASTRKAKPIWILLKQETVSGSGISWAICKSAPSSRQITMLAPHHSVFYRPDALPAAQPTVSKH